MLAFMMIPMALLLTLPIGLGIVFFYTLLEKAYYHNESGCWLCLVPVFICGFNFGLVLNVLAIPLILLVGPFFVCYALFFAIFESITRILDNKKRARARIQDLIEGRLRLDGVVNSGDSSLDDDEIRLNLNYQRRASYDSFPGRFEDDY